jgi:hypothetical protein
LSDPKELLKAHLADIERPTTFNEVGAIMSSTVKEDDESKQIVFAACLNAQTEQDQFNISFQAESSTGKTYIPLEVLTYFPEKEVVTIASASATSFFHEEKNRQWDEERECYVVDLEKKILVFLDQPHFLLLERLRPLLSHDKKELEYRITDRKERTGLRTKKIVLRGYPVVIFCTGKLDPNEQEKTRMILLSPNVNETKIKEALKLIAKKNGQRLEFKESLESDPRRKWLMTRIDAVRNTGITDVYVDNPQHIYNRFVENHSFSKPRDMRDFPRIIALIKAHALLNCFHRERLTPTRIKATEEDIQAGFELYAKVSRANEFGLSPYVWNVYDKVIQPLLASQEFVEYKQVGKAYYQYFHKPITRKTLTEVIDQLENAALIRLDSDPNDKRRTVICSPLEEPNNIPNDCVQLERHERISETESKSESTVSGHISRKLVCASCYKKREYEALGLPIIGKLSEGTCQDCGAPAELLIDISEPRSDRLATVKENVT